MAYEQKPGDFALFANDKSGNENWPDRRGYFIAHRDIRKGEKIEIAGWIKQGKNGPFLSGKISDPREQRQRGGGTGGGRPTDLDDEIPF